MKIVATDNYARETVAEHLVCENVTLAYGEKIVASLNKGDNPAWYYRLVENDYKLWSGMEELV